MADVILPESTDNLESGESDPLQTGFRRHHSIQTALLKRTDDILCMAIDKKEVTLLLLFDFCKAFDTVSPPKFLRKLRQLKFPRLALLWIKSYLQGHSQMVITNENGNSDWLETNLGVPPAIMYICQRHTRHT